MSIPAKIFERLAAVGASPADVEERFVRGAGPGGQKIKIFQLIPTAPG